MSLKSSLKKYAKFVAPNLYEKAKNQFHRIDILEQRINRLEKKLNYQLYNQRDNSLNSGERVVETNYDHVPKDHLARYQMTIPYIQSSNRVLDIACGTGYGTNLLAIGKKDCAFTGVDISSEAIEFAKSNFLQENITYLAGEVFVLSPESCFDTIICFETLEHIKEDEVFFEQLINRLTDDGTLILSVPHAKILPVEQTRNHFHFRHYNVEDIQYFCTKFDLMISKILGQGNADDPEIVTDTEKKCLIFIIKKKNHA